MHRVSVKRIYEPASSADGYRILVDRLWPRGVSKDGAKLDLWLREVGPSDSLRKWFGHEPSKYSEFKKKYRHELASSPAYLRLKQIALEHEVLTLLFSAKNEEMNQAVALAEFLREDLGV